jgi:type III pantothenate kinase
VTEQIKIALAIGNSRYHWAWFLNTELQSSWDTAYWTNHSVAQLGSTNLDDADFLGSLPIDLQQILVTHQLNISTVPIWLVSVVPIQTEIWQQLPQVEQITLADLPLLNLYPTLGIDRALAILGAGEYYGYPALVIDGGTALTITGVTDRRSLVGGAIMPGLRLQFNSLFTDTAALPEIELPSKLPSRWGNNTSDAIASGILHTVCSGLRDFIGDWEKLYPHSKILVTGGDGEILTRYLQSILAKDLTDRIYLDRQLLFRGLVAII